MFLWKHYKTLSKIKTIVDFIFLFLFQIYRLRNAIVKTQKGVISFQESLTNFN